MADEFGGAGSDFSASTPQTNTISTSQPNVDSVESSQSASNAPVNTNTSVNTENRSEGLQRTRAAISKLSPLQRTQKALKAMFWSRERTEKHI